jgi:sensor histidine kinase YesM
VDNGKGIDENIIEEINNGTNEGIGIKNIKLRLSELYKGDASIRFDSKNGRGTVVTIRIPFELILK